MTQREKRYFLLILIAYVAACLEYDIFLPALPDMMDFFETNEEVIQSLVTWNSIGVCLSGPFYGPISDAFGRRKPLVFALTLFTVGGVFTLLSNSFNWVLLGRVLQGLGSGGCFTLGSAIIFDVFRKEKAIHAVSLTSTIIPLVMAGAPALGGYLNKIYGFRSNFLAIAIFASLSLINIFFFFDESLPKEKRSDFKLKAIIHEFKIVLSNRSFWLLSLAVSFLFSAYFIFVTSSSLLYVKEFKVSGDAFIGYQVAILLSFVGGSLSGSYFLDKWGVMLIKSRGAFWSLLSISAFVVFSLWMPTNPFWMTFFMSTYSFACAWVINTYFAEAMEIVPEMKGVSASLLTSFRMLFASIFVALTAHYYDNTIYPVMTAVAVLIFIGIGLTYIYENEIKKT